MLSTAISSANSSVSASVDRSIWKCCAISPLRLAIHRILTDQDEGRQQHRFKGQDRGQKRKWIGIERPYCEGIPEEPQQDKDRLNDHEINRADEPAHLVGDAVKRGQLSFIVLFEL